MNIIKKVKGLLRNDIQKGKWTDEEYDLLDLVHTDIYDNKYYKFKDLLQMSVRRHIAAEMALRNAEYCMRKEDLLDFIKKMKDNLNSGIFTDAAYTLHEMEARLLYVSEENTLVELATVYFYIEHEPLTQYAPAWQEKKRNNWRLDEDTMNFFLRAAFSFTNQYSKHSNLDILTYLQGIKKVASDPNLKV